MPAVIGFDRRVELDWLDTVADRLAQGWDRPRVRSFFHDLLKSEHPTYEARKKTITVLQRLWFVPEDHQAIRDQALELLPAIPSSDRIWLHWGMMLLAYPFFRDTAAISGRLIDLQGDFTLAQVQRRLVESWGERSTARRASRRILRNMVLWGVLVDTDTAGHFRAAPKRKTKSEPLQLWFIEASHCASSSEVLEAKQLMKLPTSFPFEFDVGVRQLRRSGQFDIQRQGLDMEMVSLKPASGAKQAVSAVF